MVDEKYIDGIGEIVATGMVVRFDLLAIDPTTRGKDGKMKPVLRQRVVMPLDGFVQAVEKLGRSIPQLEKAGVIKRKANGKADPAGTLAAALKSAKPATNEPQKQ